jgi:hypothetical protein
MLAIMAFHDFSLKTRMFTTKVTLMFFIIIFKAIQYNNNLLISKYSDDRLTVYSMWRVIAYRSEKH